MARNRSRHNSQRSDDLEGKNTTALLQQMHALSESFSRAALMAQGGTQYQSNIGPLRDIWNEAGYDTAPTFEQYWTRYKRQDVTRSIINAYPDATWREAPRVFEKDSTEPTDFEKKWSELNTRLKMWHYIRRADILSQLDDFAVLLLGFNDISVGSGATAMEKEVTEASELMYMKPYRKDNAIIHEIDSDISSPHYGLPKSYRIKMKVFATGVDSDQTIERTVHWTRVLHFAENCLENDYVGTTRIEACLNRLHDLEKILSADGEGYWRASFSGVAAIKDPEYSWDNETRERMEHEFQIWAHKLSRILKLEGVDVKQLVTRVANPAAHVQVMIQMISAATGIPSRILIGSERGELASSQDEENWQNHVDERRELYAVPMIVQPLVRRLIDVGILPEPSTLKILWPERKTSEQNRATLGGKETEMLFRYASTPDMQRIITPYDFFTKIMRRDEEETRAIIERAATQPPIKFVVPMKPAQLGNTTPNDPANKD